MDIEKMLRQFKETADETLLRDINDTTALEKSIRSKVGTAQKRKAQTFWMAGTAVVAVILVCFLTLNQLQTENHSHHANPATNQPNNPSLDPSPSPSPPPSPNPATTDQEIEEKVSFLKQQLKLGLTQEQVKALLGGDYKVVNDNGDLENGADAFWSYSYFKQAGYVPTQPAYMVDEDGLRTRKVGINLFLGWKQQRLYLYSISYVKGKENEVMIYVNNPDGTIMQENITNPNPVEEMEQGPFQMALDQWKKERYEEFAKEKTDQVLYGLDPIVIFKMYYHAKELNDYETQYAFYMQDPEYEIPSLLQFLQEVKRDKVGIENERKFVQELKEHAKRYEIKKQNENEAIVWITYDHDKEPLGFRLKKDEKGIWKVGWMPIQ